MKRDGERKSPRRKPPSKGDYEVGYGKPPKASQYPPGVTGNKNGRPKGKKDPNKILMSKPARAALRDELFRIVQLPDGTKVSAFQLVARATVAAASKGSAHAQRTIFQYGHALEQEVVQERIQSLREAWQAKFAAQSFLDDWLRAGNAEKDAPLHPDDIIIDHETGEARMIGPAGPDRLGALRLLIEAREDAQARVLRGVQTDREGSGDILTEFGRWFAEKTFDMFNACLPPRFQKALIGRLPADAPRPVLAEGRDIEAEIWRLVKGDES